MNELPQHVSDVLNKLRKEDDDGLLPTAEKLIQDTPELIAMWRAFGKRANTEDDLWVWVTVHLMHNAMNLPPFHYKPKKDRDALVQKLTKAGAALIDILKENDLDLNIVYNDGKIFNGFFPYEGFSPFNQQEIDKSGRKKLLTSNVIREVTQNAINRIEDEPLPGKTGKNAAAIRFVRQIVKLNEKRFGFSLYIATAVATNTLFNTAYEESDIRNLVSR